LVRVENTVPVAAPEKQKLPKATHAIVVLGMRAEADGTPSSELRHRLKIALKEARRDPKAAIVVSGAAVHTPMPEALAMKNWLVKRGIDPARIVMEDQARLTIENAEFVVPLLKAMGVKRITLDTSTFHMARSMVLMKSALRAAGMRGIKIRMAPASDHLGLKGSVQKAVSEVKAIARDVVNQRQMHKGRPLALVPAQVTQIDNWDKPPEGYIDWKALLGKIREEGDEGLITHVAWL
jgi:vancomycin permeability regulator SanA